MHHLPQPSTFSARAPLQELLQQAKSKYQLRFETVKVGESSLQVLQLADMENYVDHLAETLPYGQKLELPFWAKIWPTSILLSYYLQRMGLQQQGTMLELGSGVGVCGLFAAQQGYQVVISDTHEDALLFSRINILQNNLQDRAEVAKVDFTSHRLQHSFHYILGSEILYQEDCYRPLLDFLQHHMAPGPDSEAILAKSYNLKAEKFFQLAHKEFQVQEKTLGYRQQAPAQEQSSPEKYLSQIYRLRPLKNV
ncbi:MAG: class I SAM-dependent methyltransferase [Desulfohalobiaceae bacterium]